MAKIVVMGAGIGGISQVYELRKELGKEHEIFLIGDSDRFESVSYTHLRAHETGVEIS